NPVKEILFRAADKRAVETLLVANQRVNVPPSPNIRAIQVPKGFDVADNEIVQRAEPGDLIITADIPLASAVIDKGAFALNPRGEFYTTENIRQRLNMRDFMETLRSSGIQSGGPPPLTQQDRQAFANALDRFLTKNSQH
ncbi:MAG TPA: YaiI/YqxD family protein, partial [Candidatus Glassbacteria bacterium]|nr:YaiI/YqxD family protein [Candidatus Glassbacteria bacterium]